MPQQIEVPGMGIVEFPDGMSDDQISAAIQQNMPTAMDKAKGLYKAFDRGIAKTVAGIGGSVGSLTDAGAAGLDRTIEWLTGQKGPDRSQSVLNKIPTIQSVDRAIQNNFYDGAEPYKPQNRLERYTETAGEFALGGAGRGAGLLRRLLTNVAAPTVASETAGQLTEGTKAEPVARVVAAMMAPSAVSGASRLVTPLPISPQRQRLVDILADEGVTSLTAGQRTGNKSLQYAESALGDAPLAGQGAARIQQEGQRQFTEAAMRRAGAGPDAAPEVLLANNDRLGQNFRDLAARNNLRFDQQFGNEAGAAVAGYQRVPPSQQRAVVEGYVQDIVDHMRNGSMPGPFYQEMRSRLSRQANGLRQSDPTLSETLRGLRNALDDAMGRSISQADRELWNTTRREYAAQKVLEKSASRAGEATAEGQIVPANLRNTVAAENRGHYARGQGDFSELARAGSGVMAPLPNSGTGQRVNTLDLVTALPKAALGITVGRALMSRPVQSYLSNQLLAPAPAGSNSIASVVNAILAAPDAQRLLMGR